MSNFYAALEIGTSRTVLAIAEPTANDRLKMTCHAEIPSTGIRKSRIYDIAQATQSIRSVLAAVEKKQEKLGSRITVGNAFLVVSGHHIASTQTSGTVAVQSGKVSDEDIENAIRAVNSIELAKGRELLDVAEQNYCIDQERNGTAQPPKGRAAHVLHLNSLQIHADANLINDARTAAGGAHLEIRDTLFATTCAAEAVLDESEKNNGVLVLDLGGGSTGYAAYANGYLAASGVIGVGGDHVTNDIAQAFKLMNNQAEEIKVKEAGAMLLPLDEQGPGVQIPNSNPFFNRPNNTIQRQSLNTVVNDRVEELFRIIAEELGKDDEYLLHSINSIVLTGNGAALRDIDALAQKFFSMNVRIGRPIHIDGLDDEPFPASFAAISGALMYAHRNYEEKSIFDGIRRFFK